MPEAQNFLIPPRTNGSLVCSPVPPRHNAVTPPTAPRDKTKKYQIAAPFIKPPSSGKTFLTEGRHAHRYGCPGKLLRGFPIHRSYQDTQQKTATELKKKMTQLCKIFLVVSWIHHRRRKKGRDTFSHQTLMI